MTSRSLNADQHTMTSVHFTIPPKRTSRPRQQCRFTSILVKFDDEQREDGKYLTGKLIMPDQVREETGTSLGYSLRLAKSLGKIFEDVPEHWGEYDMTIGTSGETLRIQT